MLFSWSDLAPWAVWSLGVIRTGIEIIRAASAAWAEGAAKARERRLEKQVISSDARAQGLTDLHNRSGDPDSNQAPGDISPNSDI